MSSYDIIRHRRSVRTFDGRELGAEDAEKILAYASALENPYGLPITWRILNAKEHKLSSPVIAGTDIYIAGKMKRVPHAEEAFGYAFERIVICAESLGVGTTWIAGTMNRDAFEKAMELTDDEVMPCVSPLGYPAAKMSLKESMMRKGVRADHRKPFSDLFFENDFDHPLTEEKAGELAKTLELVRWAPSAVNKQPWRVVIANGAAHFYESRSKGYVNKANGWDLQKIDIGIALCHFECGLKEQGRTGRFVIEDPGIPAPAETFYIASFEVE